jgi:hypothetical protein
MISICAFVPTCPIPWISADIFTGNSLDNIWSQCVPSCLHAPYHGYQLTYLQEIISITYDLNVCLSANMPPTMAIAADVYTQEIL